MLNALYFCYNFFYNDHKVIFMLVRRQANYCRGKGIHILPSNEGEILALDDRI